MLFLRQFLPVELTLKIKKILDQQRFLETQFKIYKTLEFPHEIHPYILFDNNSKTFQTQHHKWFIHRNSKIMYYIYTYAWKFYYSEYIVNPIRRSEYRARLLYGTLPYFN
jgi:hypothetical protein